MSQLPGELLDILVCPRCRGRLAVEPASLRCDACMLRYRVDRGIPVMLIHEAEPFGPDAGSPGVR
ncbi:MAG TPA: Trm112 family protein [Candidatus Saccharimonadales bacterium]|nr:Trm112 family protein [Candidatus Saccharimonadales bacterium]